MNITLDIKCPELAEAINNLAAAMSIRSVDGALQDIVKPAEKPFLGAEAEPEPVVEPEAKPDLLPLSVLADNAVDYAQVKAAVLKVHKAKGREAAVDLLGEFDAKVGGDLTEDQWAPFLARAEEVLA